MVVQEEKSLEGWSPPGSHSEQALTVHTGVEGWSPTGSHSEQALAVHTGVEGREGEGAELGTSPTVELILKFHP